MSSMTSSSCSAQTTFASKAGAWNFIVLGLPDDVICDVFLWRHSWSTDVTIAAFDVGDRVTLNSIIHEDAKGWSMEHGSLSLTASIDTCWAFQGRLALSKSRMPRKLRRARTHTLLIPTTTAIWCSRRLWGSRFQCQHDHHHRFLVRRSYRNKVFTDRGRTRWCVCLIVSESSKENSLYAERLWTSLIATPLTSDIWAEVVETDKC